MNSFGGKKAVVRAGVADDNPASKWPYLLYEERHAAEQGGTAGSTTTSPLYGGGVFLF